MLTSSYPAGQFIALAGSRAEWQQFDTDTQRDIEDLLDLVQLRFFVQGKKLSSVFEPLVAKIFDIRIAVLSKMTADGNGLIPYVEAVSRLHADKLQLAPYSTLAQHVAKVLDAYTTIAEPLFQHIDAKDIAGTLAAFPKGALPDYEYLRMLENHPAPIVRAVKLWLDASLQVDFALLVAELAFLQTKNTDDERIETELIPFLRQSIVRFGAYSIYTNVWTPSIEDMSAPLVNAMRIQAAALELDNGGGYAISENGLKQMLAD